MEGRLALLAVISFFLVQGMQDCLQGIYGTDCDKFCILRRCRGNNTSCDKTGRCADGCDPDGNFVGTDCSGCVQGWYGFNCMKQCIHRRCVGFSLPCNMYTGECSRGGCLPGYEGSDCSQACYSGFYGQACNFSCGKCVNQEVCHHVTGRCPNGCAPGWTSDFCQSPCDREYYGPDCNRTCAARHCITVPSCSPSTGTCDGGCQKGWSGMDCMENSSFEAWSAVNQTAVATGTAMAFIVIVLFIIIGVVMWRRKWRRRPESQLKPDHVCQRTTTPGVKVKETRLVVNPGLPCHFYDSIDDMSRDDGGTHVTIDPAVQEEMAGRNNSGCDVTVCDGYESVTGGPYEKFTITLCGQNDDYTGLERRNAYENI